MSLGVLSIATNKYLEYWFEMIMSCEKNLGTNDSLVFHVFTDRVIDAQNFVSNNSTYQIKIYEILNMGFPDATLKRYEIYSSFADSLTADYLMHLDSDMLINSPKFAEIENTSKFSNFPVTLVRHPGYWRPRGLAKVKTYLLNPIMFIKDILLLAEKGGIGAWETRKSSSAYVSRNKRINYFCGGVWFARNTEFKAMCAELAHQTNIELDAGRMPIWHDESFLNKWATENVFNELPPSYCFEPTYPQLRGIENIVEAVAKVNYEK